MSSNSWRGEDKEVKFPTHIRLGKSGGEKKFLVRKFCEILVGFFFRPTTQGGNDTSVRDELVGRGSLGYLSGGSRLIIINFKSSRLCD